MSSPDLRARIIQEVEMKFAARIDNQLDHYAGKLAKRVLRRILDEIDLADPRRGEQGQLGVDREATCDWNCTRSFPHDGPCSDRGEHEPEPSPRGSYNCPICGWNEPHSEHAGDAILRLLSENSQLKQAWRDLYDVRLEMLTHEQAGHPDNAVSRATLQSWRLRIERDVERLLPHQRGEQGQEEAPQPNETLRKLLAGEETGVDDTHCAAYTPDAPSIPSQTDAQMIKKAIAEAYATWVVWKSKLAIGAFTHSDGLKFQEMLLAAERKLIDESALRHQPETRQEPNDHGAELIHQPIPDMAGTEPRLNNMCERWARTRENCPELKSVVQASVKSSERYEAAEAVLQLAMEVLVDWHRGDSPKGTEQCPECGRFPYEGHINECRLIYAVNRWRALRKAGSVSVVGGEASASPGRSASAEKHSRHRPDLSLRPAKEP